MPTFLHDRHGLGIVQASVIAGTVALSAAIVLLLAGMACAAIFARLSAFSGGDGAGDPRIAFAQGLLWIGVPFARRSTARRSWSRSRPSTDGRFLSRNLLGGNSCVKRALCKSL